VSEIKKILEQIDVTNGTNNEFDSILDHLGGDFDKNNINDWIAIILFVRELETIENKEYMDKKKNENLPGENMGNCNCKNILQFIIDCESSRTGEAQFYDEENIKFTVEKFLIFDTNISLKMKKILTEFFLELFDNGRGVSSTQIDSEKFLPLRLKTFIDKNINKCLTHSIELLHTDCNDIENLKN
jgi:hypothetical protein